MKIRLEKERGIGQMSRKVKEEEWRGTSGDNRTTFLFHFVFKQLK